MSRSIGRFHQNILAQYRRLSENSSRQYSVSVLFIHPTIKTALWNVWSMTEDKKKPRQAVEPVGAFLL
nr:MAG TPA: hypothetical protein [Caudoviricetes sp.]